MEQLVKERLQFWDYLGLGNLFITLRLRTQTRHDMDMVGSIVYSCLLGLYDDWRPMISCMYVDYVLITSHTLICSYFLKGVNVFSGTVDLAGSIFYSFEFFYQNSSFNVGLLHLTPPYAQIPQRMRLITYWYFLLVSHEIWISVHLNINNTLFKLKHKRKAFCYRLTN